MVAARKSRKQTSGGSVKAVAASMQLQQASFSRKKAAEAIKRWLQARCGSKQAVAASK